MLRINGKQSISYRINFFIKLQHTLKTHLCVSTFHFHRWGTITHANNETTSITTTSSAAADRLVHVHWYVVDWCCCWQHAGSHCRRCTRCVSQGTTERPTCSMSNSAGTPQLRLSLHRYDAACDNSYPLSHLNKDTHTFTMNFFLTKMNHWLYSRLKSLDRY